jgi:hypothetical protein
LYSRPSLAAVGAEDVLGVAAVRAAVDRHVLDDAQDGHATFSNIFRPLRASSSAMSCGVVTITAPVSGTRWLSVSCDVAGARRHVDQQVVQVAPVGLAQQLVQRLRGHRAAPDHGLVGLDQEADRHHLHAVVLHRLHGLAVRLSGRP